MIDLANQHIVRRRVNIPISEWKVWFQTPFGLTPDMTEAVEKCLAQNADPEMHVIPVPVAIGSDGTSEVFYVRQ